MLRHSTRPRTAPPRNDIPDVDTLRDGQRQRRDRIVDAAVGLMAAVEYGDIQVKDIAERADVALGTLYRYFASKDHLMAEALLAWSTGFGERAPVARGSTAPQRVAAVYTRAARAFERQPLVYGALMQLQATQDPHARACFATFATRQTAAFGTALSGLPAETIDDIVDVMNAVLAEGLRGCATGSLSRAELRRRIARAADLVARN
mgnify:CR=1 FL=1